MISRPASLSARSTKDSKGQQMTMSGASSGARYYWRYGTRSYFHYPHITNLIQAYKHIFTSPTSAKDGTIILSDVENEPPPVPRSRKYMKSKKAIRKDVASSLQMNGKVSSRSIAYAAIQVFRFWLYRLLFLRLPSSFSLIFGTPLPGLHPMRGSIFTPAILSSSIFLMTLVAQTQKHGRANSWNGGTGLMVVPFLIYGSDLPFPREVFPNGGAHAQPSKSTSHKALEAQRAARERWEMQRWQVNKLLGLFA